MLELRNISKRFGDKQILSDFKLNDSRRKILAIVGTFPEAERTFFGC